MVIDSKLRPRWLLKKSFSTVRVPARQAAWKFFGRLRIEAIHCARSSRVDPVVGSRREDS
jgi:hypothetical protein